MSSYLITGAGRGLGLALTEQLLSRPASEVKLVFAAMRRAPSPELQKLLDDEPERLVYVLVDPCDLATVRDAVPAVDKRLGGTGLDYLINNVGVADWHPGGLKEMDNLAEIFNINVVGTHNVTNAFLPLVEQSKAKKILNIGSTVGSIEYAAEARKEFMRQLPTPAYKIAKAALSMLTVQYALEAEEKGITVFALSPGWLRTDMGNYNGRTADLDAKDGAEHVLEVIHSARREENGKFLDIYVEGNPVYPGGVVPW